MCAGVNDWLSRGSVRLNTGSRCHWPGVVRSSGRQSDCMLEHSSICAQLKLHAALLLDFLTFFPMLMCLKSSDRAHLCSQAHNNMLGCHSQLKVRAALMPEVVSAVESLESQAGASRKSEYVGVGGRPRQRSWAVSPKLFPCELSSEAKAAISEVRHRLARLLRRAVGLQDPAGCGRTQALMFGG